MVLPKNLSPEMLVHKPVLLLHMKDFSGRMCSSPFTCNWLADNVNLALASTDGIAGAVLSDGQHIVTSPNCMTIFEPPLGGDRHLFLRSNLRYGDDDPLQWPQPFVSNYGHISFIPRSPTSAKDRESIMWYIPHIADFVSDDGVFSNVGKLNRGTFLELQFLSLALIERADSSEFREQALVSQLTKILGNLLHRLEYISTSFYTMRLGVRQLQRVYLELTALLNFEGHFRSQSMSSNKVNNIMGAFTYDLAVCDQLYQAGVPVWLIRPYSALHSIRIRALARLTKVVDMLPLEPSSRPKYSSIYRGPGDVLEKYIALASDILGYLKYPNPFGSMRARPLVAPPPPAAPSRREIRSQRYTPCKLYFNQLSIVRD